jgi:hypothetical protein
LFLLGGAVVSDEGFTVTIEGRATIIYEDEHGKVIVSGERLFSASDCDWVMYANRMYLDPTLKQKLENEQRRALIVQRVLSAGKFQGITIDVDPSR